jgi:hypothetical protein
VQLGPEKHSSQIRWLLFKQQVSHHRDERQKGKD